MQDANEVIIRGPIDSVFDLITQARIWPQWHPLSVAVKGVTERPYRLGDTIIEYGDDGRSELSKFHWKVVEYERPHKVKLYDAVADVGILYTFTAVKEGTLYRREQVMTKSAQDKLKTDSDVQVNSSKSGVAALAAFVEGVLRKEQEDLATR